MKAFCYRSGHLKFGKRMPKGAILIADNLTSEQKDTLSIRARLAYDNKTFLVPGVPEAESDDEALDSMLRWKDWATKDL